MTNLLKLAKSLDFETETQYFDYLTESHINGNFTSCRQLFKQMTRDQRKQYLKHVHSEIVIYPSNQKIYNFYFDLL